MLNQEQKAAVTHRDGPILVIAGAGTGKTRVITERMAHLLEEGWARANEILALTFTERAAAEMEERLDQRLPLGHATLQVGTFHAFCEKILRRFGIDIGLSPNFKILEGVNQWKFMRDHWFEFELDYYRPLGNPTKFIDALVTHFGMVKEEGVTPEEYRSLAKKKVENAISEEEKLEAKRLMELAVAYEKYESLLHQNQFLDFAGLQYQLIRLFKSRPNILSHLQNQYRYILVDEYQDTNIAQNLIVDQLAAKHQNLMVVGDDDQSIYKFRGAAISNILQFTEKYPECKKVVLTENYRSDQAILDFAYASIQKNNPDRLEVRANINKRLRGQCPGDETSVKVIHCSTIDQEVEYVMNQIQASEAALSEMAILCRANHYALPFVEAFKKNNIPYQFLSEKGLYSKEEVRDLIALLRVVSNVSDDMSLVRVLKMPWCNVSMLIILEAIQAAKKGYHSLWHQIGLRSEFRVAFKLLEELVEFSKTHTVGETLYLFTQSIQLYKSLLERESVEAEEQIVNIATFFQKIQQFERENANHSVLDFIHYLDLAEEAGENPAAKFEVEGMDGIQISSIHAAKGLEFEIVFLPSLVARRFPSDNRGSGIELPAELVHEIPTEGDFHLQEERRLFYVATTRAKKQLHLLHSDFYAATNAQNPRPKKSSLFLQEIMNEAQVTHLQKTVDGVERFLRPESKNSDFPRKETKREPILRFSHSALETFQRCPRQYEYSQLLKIPQELSGAASFGSSLHNTLNEFYKLVEQSNQASLFADYNEDLSAERLLSIYETKWIPIGFESKAHHDALKERGKDILKKFHEHFENEMTRIEFLEKGFKLKLGKYTITGRIDRADRLEDGTLEVIDYKSGKAKSQKEVDNDRQLGIYALATRECFNMPSSKLTLYFLDDDLKVSTTPDEKKLEKLKEKLIQTADAINESDFAPTPSKFVCGFCPYKKICDAAEN